MIDDARFSLNRHQNETAQSRIRVQNMAERLLNSTPLERLKQRPMVAIVDQYNPRIRDTLDSGYKAIEDNRIIGNESYERPNNWDESPPIQSHMRRSNDSRRMDDPSVIGQYRQRHESTFLNDEYRKSNGFNQASDLIPTLGRIDDEISLLMSDVQYRNGAPLRTSSTSTRTYAPYDYGRLTRPDPYVARQFPYDNTARYWIIFKRP